LVVRQGLEPPNNPFGMALEAAFTNDRVTVTGARTAMHVAFTRVVVDHRRGFLAFGWKQGGEPTLVPYDFDEAD
jgi:hypothetical protein